MESDSEHSITDALLKIHDGAPNRSALVNQLFQRVYEELLKLARRKMAAERADHTLQPTDLVHEAYLKLINPTLVTWQNRAHFFALSANAMRQVLIDHARQKRAVKRGGDQERVSLGPNIGSQSDSAHDVLELEELLAKLKELDRRMERTVEMRVFGGMKVREIAHVLGVSDRTVRNDWKLAKRILREKLRASTKE